MDYIRYKQPLELILSAMDGNKDSIEKIVLDYKDYIEYAIWKTSSKYPNTDFCKDDLCQETRE